MSYAHRIPTRSGAIPAALYAGPVFVASVLLAGMIETSAPVGPVSPSGVLGLIVLAPFAIGIGFVVAIVPLLVGTALLGAVARRHIGLQFPAVWAMAGGLSGWLIAIGFDDPFATFALSATGAVCAVRSWRGVDWS